MMPSSKNVFIFANKMYLGVFDDGEIEISRGCAMGLPAESPGTNTFLEKDFSE
jgi:hypothetical protein